MSLQNSIRYTVVTTTGTAAALAAPSSGNNVIHGYSLKGSGAVAGLDVNDAGSFVFSIPATAAAGGTTNMFPVGVKFTGAATITGTGTNISNVTLFYNVEA